MASHIVYNEIEDKNIFEGDSKRFIEFTKTIVSENGDTDYSILGISDAIIYIEDYCENLKFIEHE